MTSPILQTMRHHWIYEVVVTVNRGDSVATAPFGVWTDDGTTLKAALFKGTSTLEAILEHQSFVINFVEDPVSLHNALNRRDRLTFETIHEGEAAGLPVLAETPPWLAVRLVRFEEQEGKVLLEAESLFESQSGPVRLINRAKGLFLESLVLSTRCHLLGQVAVDQLCENTRVIAKVAPGSSYETAIRELLTKVTAAD